MFKFDEMFGSVSLKEYHVFVFYQDMLCCGMTRNFHMGREFPNTGNTCKQYYALN